MKKVLLYLIILSVTTAFIIAGCKSDIVEEVNETEEAEEISEEEVTEEPKKELSKEVTDDDGEEKPHFTSDDGKIEFILDNVERTKVLPDEIAKWEEIDTPKEGYDFIIINLTIARITDGHIDFSVAENQTLVNDSGAEFISSRQAWQVIITDPSNPEVGGESPEGSQGTVIFEIPENSQPIKLKLAYVFFKSFSELGEHQSEEERYMDIILN